MSDAQAGWDVKYECSLFRQALMAVKCVNRMRTCCNRATQFSYVVAARDGSPASAVPSYSMALSAMGGTFEYDGNIL